MNNRLLLLFGIACMLAFGFVGLKAPTIEPEKTEFSNLVQENPIAIIQDATVEYISFEDSKVVEFDHFTEYSEKLGIYPTASVDPVKLPKTEAIPVRCTKAPRRNLYPTARRFSIDTNDTKPNKTSDAKSDFKIGWSHNRIYVS